MVFRGHRGPATTTAYVWLPEPQGVLAETENDLHFPIAMVDFADERALPLTPSYTVGTELRMRASGTITASRCRQGRELRSGEPAFWADDVPVVALATKVPFFRDLTVGDSGRDVNALRRSLRALGFEVTRSGPLGTDVRAALAMLQSRANMQRTDGRFRVGEFLWIPAGSAEIDSCRVQVGQMYVAGDIVATTRAQLTSLSVAAGAAGEHLAGARRVDVFGVTVVMPDTGSLSDPALLTDVISSPQGRQELQGAAESGSPIVATSALTVPLRLAAVPAASVYSADGTRGCVASDTKTHAVEIVGARLGMSLIVFDERPPSKILLQPRMRACDED